MRRQVTHLASAAHAGWITTRANPFARLPGHAGAMGNRTPASGITGGSHRHLPVVVAAPTLPQVYYRRILLGAWLALLASGILGWSLLASLA